MNGETVSPAAAMSLTGLPRRIRIGTVTARTGGGLFPHFLPDLPLRLPAAPAAKGRTHREDGSLPCPEKPRCPFSLPRTGALLFRIFFLLFPLRLTGAVPGEQAGRMGRMKRKRRTASSRQRTYFLSRSTFEKPYPFRNGLPFFPSLLLSVSPSLRPVPVCGGLRPRWRSRRRTDGIRTVRGSGRILKRPLRFRGTTAFPSWPSQVAHRLSCTAFAHFSGPCLQWAS